MRTPGSFRCSGFSLVELMVALAMALFLVGGVVLMYLSSQVVSTDTRELSRIQENVRFASDYIIRDLRNANFSDQLSLTFDEDSWIRARFAVVGNNEVSVRYAGRGHCAQQFEEYLPVQNRYFLANNELRCQGCLVTGPAANDVDCPPAVTLVTGVTDLSARVLRADGTYDSSATCSAAFRCIGVEVGLQFEGLRNLDTPAQREGRHVELFATFRNSAIRAIYAN